MELTVITKNTLVPTIYPFYVNIGRLLSANDLTSLWISLGNLIRFVAIAVTGKIALFENMLKNPLILYER